MESYNRDNALHKLGRFMNAALKIIVILIFIFPFYWMLSTSLKYSSEAFQ